MMITMTRSRPRASLGTRLLVPLVPPPGPQVLLGATGCYWVLLGATGCHRCPRCYWVLLGATGCYWVPLVPQAPGAWCCQGVLLHGSGRRSPGWCPGWPAARGPSA
jgi:hypothetical protein